MVTFDNTVLGGQAASIMKPIADKVRVLRDEIFTSSGPLSPMAQGDTCFSDAAQKKRVCVLWMALLPPGLISAQEPGSRHRA